MASSSADWVRGGARLSSSASTSSWKSGPGRNWNSPLDGAKTCDPGDVGGHQVGGELDARQPQAADARQPLGEGGLPHARRVLEQQVASGDEGGERELDGGALAADDATERVAGAGEQRVCCGGGEG